ncbi:MAG: YgdB family protein [Serratia symbiotica]|nr:YgdB family protein [Serratia symbiotica]
MNAPSQQGGSTLAAVMLLVMGFMLLNAQHRQLDHALLLAGDQQRYLLAYNQAASALSWGMAQRWPRDQLTINGWLCRQASGLTACVRLSAKRGLLMVRGAGEIRGSDPLWLYQLSKLESVDRDVGLIAESGGWLDFCPDQKSTVCAE